MAYTVELAKLDYKDGGPKIIAVYRDKSINSALTEEIAVDPSTTDQSVLSIVKLRLDYLNRRNAAFDALTLGVIDPALLL